MKYIPDFYHGDKIESWDELKKNTAFVIFKATQGITFTSPKMAEYIEKCEERKIPYWLYVFLNNGNELAQTKFCVKQSKDKVGKMFQGYCLDVEMGNHASKIKEALDWLQKNTGKCMIYTMYSQYEKYKEVISNRGDCAWWEARYGKNDGTYSSAYPCHKGADLYQFTSKGTCPGIKNRCDLSILTGRLPESWFVGKSSVKEEHKKYSGSFPSLDNGRGWYEKGDGISAMKKKQDKEQIRLIQQLVNWIANTDLKIDGKYGAKTEAAVREAQAILGVVVDGKFGEKTLEAAKRFER